MKHINNFKLYLESKKDKFPNIQKKEIDGFIVYIGKDSKSNDYLTFNMSDNDDIWMHVKGVPGSHVVVKTKEISSKGAKETHEKVGLGGTTPKHRESVMRAARAKEGVDHGSSIEKQANAHAATVHEKLAKELHHHIKHLTTKAGDSGHHLVGKMLEKHLVPKTSMPWSKIHVKGEHEGKINSTVTPGSEHPMNKILRNKCKKSTKSFILT
jgi:hypothetical protein